MARNAGLLTSGEIDSVRFVGPDRAGDEPRPVGRARRPLVGGRAREPRALDVQLVDERLEAVVGLRDRRAAERVGLDDVAAGLEVLRDGCRAMTSGRVSTSRSLLPLQVAADAPRTARRGSRPPSACARWIIVPIAPSRTRMRLREQARRASSGRQRVIGSRRLRASVSSCAGAGFVPTRSAR